MPMYCTEVLTLKLALKNWVVNLNFSYHRFHIHSLCSVEYLVRTSKHLFHPKITIRHFLPDSFSSSNRGICIVMQEVLI